MLPFPMVEIGKDSRLINTEPQPTLHQVKPEKVSYLKDLSIIDGHASQFLEIAQKAKQKNFNLSLALGGDLPEDQKTNSVDLYPAQSNFKYPDSNFLYHANGFSKPWNTQVDINHLIKNYPNDRWKFYLSMDYQTPEQKEKIKLFLTELGKNAPNKKSLC